MTVGVAFDHRGVHLRDAILEALVAHDVIDLGTDTDAVRIDYPDKARELGEVIQDGRAERGILVCGSGVSASRHSCRRPSTEASGTSPGFARSNRWKRR